MGIDLRCRNVSMTQHFLDMPQISAVVEHGGSSCVAEQVARASPFDTR